MALFSWLRGAAASRSSAAKNSRRRPRTYHLQFERLEERALFATRIWTGTGPDNFWATASNWAPLNGVFVAPTAGDDLVFTGNTKQNNINNLPLATNFNSITFETGGFTLSGNLILLTTGITANNVTGTNTINFSIGLTGNAAFVTSFANAELIVSGFVTLSDKTLLLDGGGTMRFTGPFDGFATSSLITKNGTGRTFFEGVNNLYSGNIVINNGEFLVRGDFALGNGTGIIFVNPNVSDPDNDPVQGTLGLNGGNTNGFFQNIRAQGKGFGGSGALNTFADSIISGSLIAIGNVAIGAFGGTTLTFGVNGVGGNVNQLGGSWNLTKAGAGTVVFTTQVSLSGETFVNNGTLTLSHAGRLVNTSKITLRNASTLRLDNQTGGANNNRVPDSAPVHLNASTIRFDGLVGGSSSERFGQIVLESGANTIQSFTTTNTVAAIMTVSAPSLARSAGATVNFLNPGGNLALGSINANNATQMNRMIFDTPVTMTNDIIPFANINNGFFAAYDPAPHPNDPGMQPRGILSAATLSTMATDIASATAGQSVRINTTGTQTVSSSVTINSLSSNLAGTQTQGTTVFLDPGVTLTLAAGGIGQLGSSGLTINGGAGSALKFESPDYLEGFILGTQTVSINVPIISDTTLTGLTLATTTRATTFGGSSPNTYSGNTWLNGGTLTLAKTANVIAVPGELVVGDGSGATGAAVANINQPGQLLFVNDPTAAATLSAVAGSTTLANGFYTVRYTFITADGQTRPSPVSGQAQILDNTTQMLRVVLPGPLPSGAIGVKIYVTQVGVPNSETLFGQFLGNGPFDLAGAPVGGELPPAISSTFADLTVKGGGTVTLANVVGNLIVRDLTMKAGVTNNTNTTGNTGILGNALIQTTTSTLTLMGSVNVMAPDTTSFYFAGQSIINALGAAARLQLLNVNPDTLTNLTFTIADGAAPNDMVLNIPVTSPGPNIGFFKNGNGAVAFTGANDYGGPTTVDAGALVVNDQGGSAITVNTNGALYGGLNNTAGFATDLTVSGIISPGQLPAPNGLAGAPNTGASTLGYLVASGGLTLNAGATVRLKVVSTDAPPNRFPLSPAGPVPFDRVLVTGGLTINNGVTLELDLDGLAGGGTAASIMTFNGFSGAFTNVVTVNNPLNLVPVLKFTGGALDISFTTSTVPVPTNMIAVGPAKGRKGDVAVYDAVTRQHLYTIAAFPTTGPTEVAIGDVNGDGVQDIIVAQGGVIRAFDGRTGQRFAVGNPLRQFRPFGAGYTGRVYIATGRLDNDNFDDIIAGRGSGAAVMRAWSTQNFNVNTRIFSVNAYPGTTGGVRVATGNAVVQVPVDFDEIYTVPGSGPVVELKLWDRFGGQLPPPNLPLNTILQPYGANYRKGAFIATGDFNNDGISDVIIGPGGATNPMAQVRVFDGADLTATLGQMNAIASAPIRVGAMYATTTGTLAVLQTRANANNQVAFFQLNGTPLPIIDNVFAAGFNGGLTLATGRNA